ncbi:TPA: hypothetical protein ISA44_005006 [Escherichia coli]|uniref:Uncharacterized protein n=5 Tax=Enterobacteriaceae TaxID=543 RepID=A0A793GEP5_ECOLX|nr:MULTISPECIES: DUF6750 family protein [Enterobacteriaceae]EAA5421785.1 hypothetical protein [Salmonella enterica subsp. enterica serovar Newport]EBH8442428.1 hypothetical protein [Salmonella enterica subsp. enterica serovar 4,5,12:b:-]EBZ1962851.1 hypothetical protein [Salmonella enterica subsp. enterica serovar Bredeney]ECC8809716.1 hypothetical protein [Salmonella enterica subsp. enterica]ECM0872034.1 hypothetical protein [Salmonella enterica subsp. enterica serovar Infantis]EDE4848056.1 
MRKYLRSLSLCHPAERWLMLCTRISWHLTRQQHRLVKVVTALLVPLLPIQAHASSDWAAILNSWANGADSGLTSLLTYAKFGGAALFIGGLVGFSRVGKTPNVTAKGCVIALLVGAGLFSVGALINSTQSQSGLETTTVG